MDFLTKQISGVSRIENIARNLAETSFASAVLAVGLLMTVASPAHAQLATASRDPAHVISSCTFPNSAVTCGYFVESKYYGRAGIMSGGRDGSTMLRLNTQPGDNNVFGSGANERTDVALDQAETGCYAGRERWYAHSFLLPNDYSTSGSWGGTVFAFHNTARGSGAANVEISINTAGMMNLHGYALTTPTPPYRAPNFSVNLGTFQHNIWYDMVYHVKWSTGSDGYIIAWINGVKKLRYSGPTLYYNQGCYLKLQNYHVPNGRSVSVIHDRVVQGTTESSVARITQGP